MISVLMNSMTCLNAFYNNQGFFDALDAVSAFQEGRPNC